MNRHSFIQKEADRCVKCGLCLPHCPTYQLLGDEGESPRGRIALMQGLVQQKLAPSEKLIGHLDRCLMCRACEAMCPSGVKYGELLEQTRLHLSSEASKPARGATQLMQRFVAEPAQRRKFTRLLRLYQSSGLGWLARHSGLLRPLGLRRFASLLPKLGAALPMRNEYPAIGKQKGVVGLFVGCMGDSLDTTTTRAAIKLLTHLGYTVQLPANQTCCGALHLRRGEAMQAAALANENRTAFSQINIDALIYCASGCGSTLEKMGLSSENSTPILEIGQFLAQIEWPDAPNLRPLNRQVAIHLPCSLTHALHQGERPAALLSKIPEITLLSLPAHQHCCGAAGDYMIRQADIADQLRDSTLEQIHALRPDIMVSSNIGCALHISAGLRDSGAEIEVIHPVTLLARQLP